MSERMQSDRVHLASQLVFALRVGLMWLVFSA
jgi:hypothetical protein